MGPLILPLLGPLMSTGLLAASCTRELVDILPFFGHVVHRYDTSVIWPLFDSLLAPLVERIFFLLNQPTTGTDDAMQQEELRRAYLVFLVIVVNRDLEALFLSDGKCPSLLLTNAS